MGFVNNLGHFIWNELSGIELIIKNGSIKYVQCIYIGPFAQFPLDEIFPELSEEKIQIVKCSKNTYSPINFQLDDDIHPLRVTANRITYELRARIIAWAISKQHMLIPDIESLNKDALTLWFNIRTHNKTWINQVTGIKSICARIKQKSPDIDLNVIFDGTPDTNEITNEIINQIRPYVYKSIDATKIDLASSIFYSTLIDLHISVVGSGLVIPTWIMGKRGIAHSNVSHIKQGDWWNNISEGSNNTRFISKKYISDTWFPSDHNFGYVNYYLNTKGFENYIEEIYPSIDISLRKHYVNEMLQCAKHKNFELAADQILRL